MQRVECTKWQWQRSKGDCNGKAFKGIYLRKGTSTVEKGAIGMPGRKMECRPVAGGKRRGEQFIVSSEPVEEELVECVLGSTGETNVNRVRKPSSLKKKRNK